MNESEERECMAGGGRKGEVRAAGRHCRASGERELTARRGDGDGDTEERERGETNKKEKYMRNTKN